MADHQIKVTADTSSGDARVAQAHVSMIAATLTVSKGDTVTWGSKDGPFRITFTGKCPVSGGAIIRSHKARTRFETDTLKVSAAGSFDYVVQIGKIEDLSKSSC